MKRKGGGGKGEGEGDKRKYSDVGVVDLCNLNIEISQFMSNYAFKAGKAQSVCFSASLPLIPLKSSFYQMLPFSGCDE